MALDELKLYSVPSAGEVLLYPVYVAPVELGVVFLYSSETANVVTLHSLIAAESAGGGTPQTVLVGIALETDTANAITPVAGGVSVAVGVALETDAANTITPVAGGVVVVLGVALETDTANVITPVGGVDAAVTTLVYQISLKQRTRAPLPAVGRHHVSDSVHETVAVIKDLRARGLLP